MESNLAGYADASSFLFLYAAQIPLTNLNSVTCPGTAAGWCKTIETFGSMSMADILAPAIRMAREGVPVHELNAEAWKIQEALVKGASPGWRECVARGSRRVGGLEG